MPKKYRILHHILIFHLLVYVFSPFFFYQKDNTVHAENQPSSISGGYGHSVILKNDGSVWTFGFNERGELGIGNRINSYEPKRIDPKSFNNEKIMKVESNNVYNIALTEKNNLYYWGEWTNKPTKKTVPFPIKDVKVSGLDINNPHRAVSLLNGTDGSVWTWGSNYYGGYGNGLSGYGALGKCSPPYEGSEFSQALTSATIESCPNSPTLKRIIPGTEVPLLGVTQLSSNPSARFIVALKNDNEVYVWGEGYTHFATKNENVKNFTIQKVIAGDQPIFLTTAGEVYRFSGNQGVPMKVNLENTTEKVIDVVASQKSVFLLTESGKVYAYGNNDYGQLGKGIPSTGIDKNLNLAKPIGVENVVQMGAGKNHVLFLKKDGNYFGLGSNNYGQLASFQDNSMTTFKKVPFSEKVKIVNARYYSSYVVDEKDNLYTWGNNNNNSLLYGYGRNGITNSPQVAKTFTDEGKIKKVKGVSTSYNHQGILLENGDLYTWGNPWKYGAGLVNGGVFAKLYNTNPNLTETIRFKDATQGEFFGIGVTEEGKVYSWGYDSNGTLGTGIYNTGPDDAGFGNGPIGLTAYQKVALPSSVIIDEVAGSYYAAYARTNDGKVYSWGSGEYGKLGYTVPSGSTPTPTLISTLPSIQKIVAGSQFALALDIEGNIWSWGNNAYGQLGLGHNNSVITPTKINGLPKIKDIEVGTNTSFAFAENGDTYVWGDNAYGQLGLGDKINRNSPRKLPMEHVKTITGGKEHTLLLTEEGEVYASGGDSFGQLGLSQTDGLSEESLIVFPPVITMGTAENQTVEQGSTFTVKGDVFTETDNVPIHISYKIEGTNKKEEGKILDYVSTKGSQPFTYNIPIDPSYELGGYTVVVYVTTENGFQTYDSVSFGVLDKKSPTIQTDIATRTWSKDPVSIQIHADDEGGSGYRGVNYAWSTKTEKPLTGWSGITNAKEVTTTQTGSGNWYLHAESFDFSGNTTYNMFGPYQIDKDGPFIRITYPLEWQQNTLDMKVDIQDEFQTITTKKWIEGTVDEQTVKNTGKNIDFTTKTIDKNNSFTFYAEDTLGNTSLQHVTISTINYPPTMKNTLQDQFVPFSKKEIFLDVETEEKDVGDTLTFVYQIDNGTKNEIVLGKTNTTNQTFRVTLPLEQIPVNKNTTITYYIQDNKQGETAKKTFQLEHYQTNLHVTKKTITENEISWTPSMFSEGYVLKRNGEILYEGIQTTFTDTAIQNNKTYKYELFIKMGNELQKIEEVQVFSGNFDIQIPNTLQFETIQMKNIQSMYQTNGYFSDDVVFTNTTDFSQEWNVHMNVKPFISKTNPLLQLENSALKLHIPNVILDNGNTLETNKEYMVDYENDVSIFTLTMEQAKGTIMLPISNEKATLQLPFSSVINKGNQTFQTKIEWKFISAP